MEKINKNTKSFIGILKEPPDITGSHLTLHEHVVELNRGVEHDKVLFETPLVGGGGGEVKEALMVGVGDKKVESKSAVDINRPKDIVDDDEGEAELGKAIERALLRISEKKSGTEMKSDTVSQGVKEVNKPVRRNENVVRTINTQEEFNQLEKKVFNQIKELLRCPHCGEREEGSLSSTTRWSFKGIGGASGKGVRRSQVLCVCNKKSMLHIVLKSTIGTDNEVKIVDAYKRLEEAHGWTRDIGEVGDIAGKGKRPRDTVQHDESEPPKAKAKIEKVIGKSSKSKIRRSEIPAKPAGDELDNEEYAQFWEGQPSDVEITDDDGGDSGSEGLSMLDESISPISSEAGVVVEEEGGAGEDLKNVTASWCDLSLSDWIAARAEGGQMGVQECLEAIWAMVRELAKEKKKNMEVIKDMQQKNREMGLEIVSLKNMLIEREEQESCNSINRGGNSSTRGKRGVDIRGGRGRGRGDGTQGFNMVLRSSGRRVVVQETQELEGTLRPQGRTEEVQTAQSSTPFPPSPMHESMEVEANKAEKPTSYVAAAATNHSQARSRSNTTKKEERAADVKKAAAFLKPQMIRVSPNGPDEARSEPQEWERLLVKWNLSSKHREERIGKRVYFAWTFLEYLGVHRKVRELSLRGGNLIEIYVPAILMDEVRSTITEKGGIICKEIFIKDMGDDLRDTIRFRYTRLLQRKSCQLVKLAATILQGLDRGLQEQILKAQHMMPTGTFKKIIEELDKKDNKREQQETNKVNEDE